MMRKHDYLRMIAQISVPEGLQERVLAQADRESVKVNEIPKFRKSTGRKLLRPAICMGLILVLVLGSVMPRNEEAVPPSGERSVGGGAFVLTAYAEEPLPAANGNLVLGGKGRTVISHTVLIPEQAQYTNYMFQFRGDHIETLTLTMDRGGVYRVGAEQSMMTVLELPAVEVYDPDVVYGLWIPPEVCARGEGDALLDGATLCVTAVFADGTQETQTYRLAKQQLTSCRNEDGSETLVPVLEGGEGETLGFYLEAEHSVWFHWPVDGSNRVSLSAPYGKRSVGTGGGMETRFHSGIDIPGEQGLSVTAAMAGTVTESGFDSARGNYLVLDHGGGLTTLYAHCRELLAQTGDFVAAGEKIALMGATGMATGPHLHFEVRQDGEARNPVAYFDRTLRDTLKMA